MRRMMQIVDATPDRFDLRIFLEAYSSAVRSFGEEVPPAWVDEKIRSISEGKEFCLGIAHGEELEGILSYSFKDRRGYSFICWRSDEVDREGLLLLIREYANRSPQGTKLRISGFHPHVSQELMSSVSEGLGFRTRRRFEMAVPLDASVDQLEAAIQYPTAPITRFDDLTLSRLDWEAYQGTEDSSLLFDSEEDNRKLMKSLLSGDYGPVLADASLCILREGRPGGMIAVTDMGDSSFLADIAVASDLRRKGIGKYLLTNAMKMSRRMKKEKMVLWVSEGNIGALSLYRSMGFSVSRTGVFYLKSE